MVAFFIFATCHSCESRNLLIEKMKTYTQHNFFKHTYCEFLQCDETVFNQKTIHYTSKKGSNYSYTDDGVYRYSNHWGRVANCRWKIKQTSDYKNQKYVVGFAKWTDFYPLHETEKSFYLTVDIDSNTTQIHHIKNKIKSDFFLFTLVDAQKREKQIQHLLSTHQWTKYFDEDILELRKKICSKMISSNKTLQEIKIEQKK